jgi:hypothetical protein
MAQKTIKLTLNSAQLRVLQQGMASIGWSALPKGHEDLVAAEKVMQLLGDAIETVSCDCKTATVNGETIHELTCARFEHLPIARKPVKYLKPAWATHLAFKDEDEDKGLIIGPVWWRNSAQSEAVVPSTFADVAGWMTLAEAQQLARHYAIELERV